MKRRLKENKKKGFTLVELIVVLVILAILAALLIPALVGYIDRAKEKQIISETRSCVMAAQTIADEEYGKGTIPSTGLVENTTIGSDTFEDLIIELADVDGDITSVKAGTDGKVSDLVYTHGKTCTYDEDATGDKYTIAP